MRDLIKLAVFGKPESFATPSVLRLSYSNKKSKRITIVYCSKLAPDLNRA